MIEQKRNHILVSDSTKTELEKVGKMRDTYEDVIQKLIRFYNNNKED